MSDLWLPFAPPVNAPPVLCNHTWPASEPIIDDGQERVYLQHRCGQSSTVAHVHRCRYCGQE